MTPPVRQLPLDLPVRAARDRESFFVSDSNALALAALDRWREWPDGRLALVGPEGAGKTHLAAVWSQETGAPRIAAAELPGADLRALLTHGALAVEDADRLAGLDEAERALFHLVNLAAAQGAALLLTGRTPPARWPVALPDLATRLAALPIARISPPDDRLLEGLAMKLLADRQLLASADAGLPRYLATRGPRSHRGLAETVAAIDRAALAARSRPSLRLAAKVLREAETQGPAA
ncbi:chromosomal replication initiator DnaA [Albimonas pacifica]|uniref:DnaA protein n=1 Tax=Albimonas pacifica TaxID=1114924 RepID=A0A1I3HZJ2_9RHOB|nr:chromosomal replication initiator DnaA [Albimonas pacifica]SFI41124.1 hypothetical protein SAMN05216258_106260 [Albimonas pacifica]